MESDWKQLIETAIIGIIFSFIVAKLISMATAFKVHNHLPASDFRDPDPVRLCPDDLRGVAYRASYEKPVTTKNNALFDGDDDWEDVGRSTELHNDIGSSSDQVLVKEAESSDWVIF